MNSTRFPLLFRFEFVVREDFEDGTLVRDRTEEIYISLNHNFQSDDSIPLVETYFNVLGKEVSRFEVRGYYIATEGTGRTEVKDEILPISVIVSYLVTEVFNLSFVDNFDIF